MAKVPTSTVGKPAVAPVDKPAAMKAMKAAKPAYNPIGNLGTFAHPAKKKMKTK